MTFYTYKKEVWKRLKAMSKEGGGGGTTTSFGVVLIWELEVLIILKGMGGGGGGRCFYYTLSLVSCYEMIYTFRDSFSNVKSYPEIISVYEWFLFFIGCDQTMTSVRTTFLR